MDEKIREIKDIGGKNDKGYIIPICVDFDATITEENNYPYIGKENPHAFDIMKRWQKEYNVGWILDTMRGGENKKNAIEYCRKRGLEFYSIGKHPEQASWTDTTKAYGIFSIDDRNVGTPLKLTENGKLSVDWLKIQEILEPILKRISHA